MLLATVLTGFLLRASCMNEVSAAFPYCVHHIVEKYCEYAINNIWITTELFDFRPTELK